MWLNSTFISLKGLFFSLKPLSALEKGLYLEKKPISMNKLHPGEGNTQQLYILSALFVNVHVIIGTPFHMKQWGCEGLWVRGNEYVSLISLLNTYMG